MNAVFYLLIPCSIFIALIFLGLFIWSVKSGQYDDTQTPGMRMLFDEKKKESEEENLDEAQ